MGSEERHPGRLAHAAVVPSTIDARTRRILVALPSIIDRIGTGSELRTSLHELLPVIGVVAGILEAAPSDSGDREELAEIREAFAAVDADGSGQLNPKEFREAIAQLKGPSAMTDGDITALFDSIDTDHSGKIDMHEFIRAALGK